MANDLPISKDVHFSLPVKELETILADKYGVSKAEVSISHSQDDRGSGTYYSLSITLKDYPILTKK